MKNKYCGLPKDYPAQFSVASTKRDYRAQMAELINAVSDRVVTTIAVSNEDTKTKVVIELDGLKKRDFYGTNLYLTGSTNWYVGQQTATVTAALLYSPR